MIHTTELLTTFHLGKDFFGLEVMKVQEVTAPPLIVSVPLAPKFVRGLINLRGQLATALGLRELFEIQEPASSEDMSVVCRMDGNLISLMVDSVGDVVEAHSGTFEPAPENMSAKLKPFVKGIYKMDGVLLTILDLDRIAKELSPSTEK